MSADYLTKSCAAMFARMLEAISEERSAVRDSLGPLEGLSTEQILNGFRFFSEPGANVYRFETEIGILLPDGTRVQIQAPGVIGSAEVIDHDPALGHIGLVVREDIGESVSEAILIFDSTRLLDLLASRIDSIRNQLGLSSEIDLDNHTKPDFNSESNSSILRAFTFLTGQALPHPPAQVSRKPLSPSQNRALSFIVNQEVAFLWGPPGTGKTQTLAHLAHELVERGETLFLTAHTNIATDNALHRVLLEKQLPHRKVVRIGYCGEALRPFRISLDDQVESLIKQKYLSEAKEMDRLSLLIASQIPNPPPVLSPLRAVLPRRFRAAGELLAQLPTNFAERHQPRASELLQILSLAEKEVIREASIVASTLTRVYTSKLLKDFKTDTVIIDEASIASLPLSFLAACLAQKRIVAVGDFMQLPAIVQSDKTQARQWLGRHVFSSAKCDNPSEQHPLRVMLDEQWRMHPKIAKIVSELFYANKLQNAHSVLQRNRSDDPALILIDTSEIGATSQIKAQGSKHNLLHAQLVANLVARIVGKGVAVIAPYRAQVKSTRDAIRGTAPERLRSGQIEVFTVHRFQGRDKEVVIFDLVESPGTACRFLHEQLNPDAPKLINVAMSRAKEKLIIIANLRHISAALGDNALLNRVFRSIRVSGGVELVAGNRTDGDFLAKLVGYSCAHQSIWPSREPNRLSAVDPRKISGR